MLSMCIAILDSGIILPAWQLRSMSFSPSFFVAPPMLEFCRKKRPRQIRGMKTPCRKKLIETTKNDVLFFQR